MPPEPSPPAPSGLTGSALIAEARAQRAAERAARAAARAAAEAQKTSLYVELVPGSERERAYIAESVRQAADAAVAAGADALALRVRPAVRWVLECPPNVAQDVDRDTHRDRPGTWGYVKRVEPGLVRLNQELNGAAAAGDLDDLLGTVGHECGHLLDHQGLTDDEALAQDEAECPHVEAACTLVGKKLLPRMREAVRRAEFRRRHGLRAEQ